MKLNYVFHRSVLCLTKGLLTSLHVHHQTAVWNLPQPSDWRCPDEPSRAFHLSEGQPEGRFALFRGPRRLGVYDGVEDAGRDDVELRLLVISRHSTKDVAGRGSVEELLISFQISFPGRVKGDFASLHVHSITVGQCMRNDVSYGEVLGAWIDRGTRQIEDDHTGHSHDLYNYIIMQYINNIYSRVFKKHTCR